jgi:para-aminobenzoate synthetase component 1
MYQLTPIIEDVTLVNPLEETFANLVDDPHPFWLDSSSQDNTMGRWSFMGCCPFLVLKSFGASIYATEQGITTKTVGDPFTALRDNLNRFTLKRNNSSVPFLGGAVGFFSYDLGRMVEDIPDQTIDDLQTPDIFLGFYHTVLAIDHQENRTYIVASGLPEENGKAKDKAAADIAGFKTRIFRPAAPLADPWLEPDIKGSDIGTHFTQASYCEAVERVREYIMAGDIYQANMTQRFDAPLRMPPYQLYRRLRHVNPAPFAAYLDCGDDLRVLSSSPERYLLLEGKKVETRPIKGTLPRGKTPQEDQENKKKLLSSIKDQAELIMIVDLERNDIGRVCAYGTVRVPEPIVLEEYATVFHLVSTVCGELAPGKDAVDLLKATFPGGSITGAPKIRSMEIIEELEPVRRGVYTGSIGYIGFDGRVDLNIAIRTLVNKDDQIYFQAGGGIVFDSNPVLEYEETLHKAKALLKSLGVTSFAKQIHD